MTENPRTFKSFNQLEMADLPPLPASLVEGRHVLSHLGAEDLREMSKFGEFPNLAGLAAHPVRRPAPPTLEPEPTPGAPELPGGVVRALNVALKHEPALLVHGLLAGDSGQPFAVAFIVPQRGAHLAQAFEKMLWPAPAGDPRVDYALFLWPESLHRKNGSLLLETMIGHWPAQRTGIAIGYDDPALAARMLAGAARRHWEAAGGIHLTRAGEGFATAESESVARYQSLDQYPAAWEELSIEDGHALTPLWANPLMPAALLAPAAAWRAAALSVGALPLGVEVDAEGRFPIFSAVDDLATPPPFTPEALARGGWVVVPRTAFPAPCLRQARRWDMV